MPKLARGARKFYKALQLFRVADGVVQQGHLRVRKFEKLLDGGNVHGHVRAGHQAHAGTEQINILAHDARVGSHRHLRAGVAAAELGLVRNDEDALRGRLRPILTVGNEPPVATRLKAKARTNAGLNFLSMMGLLLAPYCRGYIYVYQYTLQYML